MRKVIPLKTVTCYCGCKTSFEKKIYADMSTQTRHFFNKDHYRSWWDKEGKERVYGYWMGRHGIEKLGK